MVEPSSEKPSVVPALAGQRVGVMGKLAGMTLRETQRLLRAAGAVPVERSDSALSMLVLGEQQQPLIEAIDQLDEPLRAAAEEGRLRIVPETQLWQWLGLVDDEQGVQRLYTPAMLAELLGVPVAVIRRWHRRGLIVPKREVRRLPYFDFQEAATARRLAQLLGEGVSPKDIERQLSAWARWLPNVQRPLTQLSLIVEGARLLVRRGGSLLEPGGQYRIDFAAEPESTVDDAGPRPDLLPDGIPLDEPTTAWVAVPDDVAAATGPMAEQLREAAQRLDEQGYLADAIEHLRSALAAAGPSAEVCFELAEMLYRAGDLPAARERYYMALELDENFVEARANLGCVLAELGQPELARAAFEGALAYHADYADARYLLARTLDELEQHDEAARHWQAFLELAPDSPWAEAARQRLGLTLPDEIP